MNNKDYDAVRIVLNQYVVNKGNNIDFKGELKSLLDKNEIKREDAVNIVFELMYSVINYNYDEDKVKTGLYNLVNKIKEYDSKYEVSTRNSILFFRDYSHERILLSNFHKGLKVNNSSFEIDDVNSDNYSLNSHCGEERKNDKYLISPEIREKMRVEKAKRDLDAKIKKQHTDDLRNILKSSDLYDEENNNSVEINDKNSNNDFSNKENGSNVVKPISSEVSERIKIDKAKRILAAKLRKKHPNDWRERLKSYDLHDKKLQDELINENKKKILVNSSANANYAKNRNKSKIKKVVKSNKQLLKSDENTDKKIKEEIDKTIEKIKIFNKKSFSEMILSKEEYEPIYKNIHGKYMSLYFKNKNVKDFNYYYSNFSELYKIKTIELELKENSKIIDNFHNEIFHNGFLSSKKRNEIIKKYDNFYKNTYQLMEFPDRLNKKIFLDYDNLKEFLIFYKDLIDYTNIDGYNNNNVIMNVNKEILNAEINQNKDFFKDISDNNKKMAIVIDENNVKIVAGAGAGKTFIIQKKINYMIENGLNPEKILCLCYTRKSVDQLDNEVNKNRENKVKVFTFHEFCRRVIKDCGLIRSSNRYLLDKSIRNYVSEISKNPSKLSKLTEYFSYYNKPPFEYNRFNSIEEYEEYSEGKNLVSLKRKFYQNDEDVETIKGEVVKSLGELLIANYLFMHEIEYEYERSYPFNYYAYLIKNQFLYSGNYFSLNQINENYSNEEIINMFIDWELDRKKYKPDFYLPEYDIYLEHFGVNKNMEATFLNGKSKEKYEKEMYTKEIFHELYGTKLIKTYFYYLTEGRLLKELEILLKENNVKIGQMDQKKIVEMLINNEKLKDFDNFKKLVKSFINIYESKNEEKIDFNKFRAQNISKDIYSINRQDLFLNIVEEIYNKYYEEAINGTLSHNHEILFALNLIQNKIFNKKYDYIFVDEYQDVNPVRCKLLQELQKNSNSKLFVVGDDWQSIYRFSGSDVNLFIDFEKYFKNVETIIIKENRRNPQKLIDVSSKFVLHKGNLHKKELNYYKKDMNNILEPVNIVKYKKDDRRSKVLKLDAIINDILKKSKNPKILILGRNNSDIEDYIGNMLFVEKGEGKRKKIIYSEKPKLNIDFMSIHQSKGLQSDYVIILNLENKLDGFPNKIEDDPILRFVNSPEEYEYAEERRLFYVALTRAKQEVYLLTATSSQSVFVKELLNGYNGINDNDLNYRVTTKNLYRDTELFKTKVPYFTNIPCPNCKKGVITIILNNNNIKGKRTKYVRCSKKCGYDGGPYPASLEDIDYIEKCPECRGILVKRGDMLKCCLNYHEGCTATKELKLDEKELEFDYD